MNGSRKVVLLPREDKTAWLLSPDTHTVIAARLVTPAGQTGSAVPLGPSGDGWDATIDTVGTAWVAYVDTEMRNIFVRRAAADEWGPALQVSGAAGAEPLIRPDEFGNVWVSWKVRCSSGRWEIRVCRMGPRSGQEMVAATFDDEPDYLDSGTRGGVLWHIIGDTNGRHTIVTGTEHNGFNPSFRLS